MSKGKRKVFVANMRSLGPVFDMTPELMTRVAGRYPGVGEQIECEFDYDLENFDTGIRSAEILIGWEFPREQLAEAAPALRWIHLMGAGLDQCLPLDWLPTHVSLTTSAGAHAVKAGEFLATAVLMLNNRFPAFVTNQRSGNFKPIVSAPITGKTLLLVGVGGIGGAAADRCKALGMHIIGVRPSARAHPSVDEMFDVSQLHEVIPRADFILISAPLTSHNRGLFSNAEFARLKPGAGLVNLARHAVVDEHAMIEALEDGRLGGAIVDVEDPDHVAWDQRMWSVPNLVIVPHCGTNDPANFKEYILDVFFENLQSYLEGKSMKTLVGREREY
jgi:phosphoglycerate dehydrogenase-like enzyme